LPHPSALTDDAWQGPGVHDQKRRIVMALTVAGFVTGGTKIDSTKAVDVSYPGLSPLLKFRISKLLMILS